MPFLDVKIGLELDDQTREKVSATLTELTVRYLGKKKEVTAVAVGTYPSAAWFVGGSALNNQRVGCFFLEVKVTDGTNTKNEKAEYIRRVFDAMKSLLGPLSAACYIVIHEVSADSWGYSGHTQEYRYVSGQRM